MSEQRTARAAIVTGATGLIGHYLLPLLEDRGFTVQAVSRHPPRSGGSATWREIDLQDPPPLRGRPLGPADVAFHAAPLWLLPPWLKTLAGLGVRRLVAFSSTSRVAKEASGDPHERQTARRLAEAEAAVARVCGQAKMEWTLLRPTLVYGGGRDRNVTDIARVIRWLGFFPLAGEGRGRRQPVHAEDLARGCLAVLDSPATSGQIYDTPGGETLTYLEMVRRIARGVGRQPRVLQVPPSILRGVLAVARRFEGHTHLTPAMASRMAQDLIFDATRARRDFGYDPRPFRFPGESR